MRFKKTDLDQDCDGFYALNVGSIYQEIIPPSSIADPLAVADLAHNPVSACETPVLAYPAKWLRIEIYLSAVSSGWK
jgi:hypothetical protein